MISVAQYFQVRWLKSHPANYSAQDNGALVPETTDGSVSFTKSRSARLSQALWGVANLFAGL